MQEVSYTLLSTEECPFAAADFMSGNTFEDNTYCQFEDKRHTDLPDDPANQQPPPSPDAFKQRQREPSKKCIIL